MTLSRVMKRLRSPALREVFEFWNNARSGGRPPRLADLTWGAVPQAQNAFTVAADIVFDRIGFHFLRVGSALRARLGRNPETVFASSEQLSTQERELIGSLEAAYRRCARTLAPSYEHARYDFGDGAPVTFERLLLPVSEDGIRVSHLVGIAIFSDEA